jgi:(p)ppGpp synthase/HD superfamily hydrolase
MIFKPAIAFAVNAHSGVAKGIDAPYILHTYEVAAIRWELREF